MILYKIVGLILAVLGLAVMKYFPDMRIVPERGHDVERDIFRRRAHNSQGHY